MGLISRTAGINRNKPVIAACASGARSASAARLLASQWYPAYSLHGGMGAWRSAGEPVR